jgi:hypothetical protein
MASFNRFNSWTERMAEDANLASDQFAIALTNTLPTAANTVIGDIVEISYTGFSSRNLTTSSSSQTGGNYSLVFANLQVGTTVASATFRYVVVYDVTVNALVGWYDIGSTNIAANSSLIFAGMGLDVVAAVFNPADLFTGGYQGGWYDPSDLSTMFQVRTGWNNNIQAPVTSDGQPVGLILDKSQGLALSSPIIPNGDFSGGLTDWTTSGTWAVNGSGQAECSVGGNLESTTSLTVGKWYKIEFDIVGSLLNTITIFCGISNLEALTFGSSGRVNLYMQCAGDGRFIFNVMLGASPQAIDNIVVREIAGNHAFQATASARPLYKTSAGKHWLENDGVDDVLESGFSAEFDNQWEFWAAFKFASRGGINQVLFAKAAAATSASSSAASQGMFQRSDVVERIGCASRIGGGASNYVVVNSAYVVGGSAVTARVTKTTGPDLLVATSNGNTANVTPTNTGSPATNAYRLYSPSSGAVPMYGAFAINRPLTSDEAVSLKAYLDAKAGL